MMDSIGFNLLMLARVSLAYLMLYIVLPTLLTRVEAPADGVWDRMFAGLTHATLLTIVMVHVLVSCQLYETFSLLFAYALVLIFWSRVRGKSTTAGVAGMNLMVRLLNASEDHVGFVWGLVVIGKEWFSHWSIRATLFWRRLWHDPFLFSLPTALLSASALIRLRHALTHAAYSLSDPYEHLAWVKYLGNNQIYTDGIYPQGYHALISALAKLSFIDPYWLIRFFGGIGTCVLVAAVFYFTLRLTRSHAAGLISLAVYGLISDARFPTALGRQTAALPQEYSLVFGLCALYFLSLYLEQQRTGHLLLFLEAVAITAFIHPYTTIYLVVWSIVFAGLALLQRRARFRQILKIGVCGALAVLLGASPLLLGSLLGKEWFGAATEFVISSIGRTGLAPAGEWWMRIIAHNPYLDLLLPLGCLGLLGAWMNKTANRFRVVGVTAVTTVMLVLFRAGDLGLPELSEQSRTGVFLAPFLAIVYGCGIVGLCQLLAAGRSPWTTRLAKAMALTICLAVAVHATPPLPTGTPLEYDAAAQNYLRIKTEFPVTDWTIIGPSEQLQQAVGIGWHYDLLRFVQDFTWENATDPEFQLPIPTHHIFFYLEKRSLLDQARVEDADVNRPLEQEGANPYAQYYRSPEQRLLLQGKAWHWMKLYQESHPGVTVFYEDEQMLIYHIVHEVPAE